MDKKTTLQDLVKNLRETTKNGPLDKQQLLDAIDALKKIGYEYDPEAYPELRDTEKFIYDSRDSPKNLSEALLWKLGKWKVYKKFASQYANKNASPKNTDVVIFAFAKHLRNKSNPIYDQHALRAMWAICGQLSKKEREKCKKFLVNSAGKWKNAGSGKTAVACYRIFAKRIRKMVDTDARLRDLDLLLMPLGQALKDLSKNYRGYSKICKFDRAD